MYPVMPLYVPSSFASVPSVACDNTFSRNALQAHSQDSQLCK